MGREKGGDEEEESERSVKKKRKREKKRKSDTSDIDDLETLEVGRDHKDILQGCDKEMRKTQGGFTFSGRKRKRSRSPSDRECEIKRRKKKKEKRKKDYGERLSKDKMECPPARTTAMEVLELEMRARAIKAFLLKADQKKVVKEKKTTQMQAVQEESDEVEIIEDSRSRISEDDNRRSTGHSADVSNSLSTEKAISTSSSNLKGRCQITGGSLGKEKYLPILSSTARSQIVTVDNFHHGQSRIELKILNNMLDEAENTPQRMWTKRYDKELPEALTSLCLGGECRLCKVDFNSDAECEQHYLSEHHFKRVEEKLEVLFADRPGEPIGWRQTLAPKQLPALKNSVKPEVVPSFPSPDNFVKEAVKVTEKRAFHKEWAQFFDRALPKSILNLCLENECKLCKVSLKHEVMAKQHFEGKTHAKNVNLELEEIFKTSGEARPKRIDGGHKKKKTKVSHIKTPTLTEEVIAAASKPPEVNPFLQDYMDDMDQNLILCRNIGKRPKYWY